MERKYARTFFSTETGGQYLMNHFLDNAGNDELREQIFSYNQALWRPIRPQVAAWMSSRFEIWKREKPAWFTDALRRSIPTDMLPPRVARLVDAPREPGAAPVALARRAHVGDDASAGHAARRTRDRLGDSG
jgi:hypothetical protein